MNGYAVPYLLEDFLVWLVDRYSPSHTSSVVTGSHFTGSLAIQYTTVSSKLLSS